FWKELYLLLLNPDEGLCILDFQCGYFDPLLAAVPLEIPYFAIDTNMDRHKIFSADNFHLLCDFLLRNCEAAMVAKWISFNMQAMIDCKDVEKRQQLAIASAKKNASVKAVDTV